MRQTIASLERKIKVAGDLQTVVHTMNAMAASNIGQYDKSKKSLSDYYRNVELSLGLCFREISIKSITNDLISLKKDSTSKKSGVVVFGSDQGLVGQFNNIITEYTVKTLNNLPGNHRVWSVGDRVQGHLLDAGLELGGTFDLPNSVKAITPLVGQILVETLGYDTESNFDELYLIYNHITAGAAYESTSMKLFPIDKTWRSNLTQQDWPTQNLPEVIGMEKAMGLPTFKALIQEYLFVSVFRACTESLASENASRLRQTSINEELFDVISGFEALSK